MCNRLVQRSCRRPWRLSFGGAHRGPSRPVKCGAERTIFPQLLRRSLQLLRGPTYP